MRIVLSASPAGGWVAAPWPPLSRTCCAAVRGAKPRALAMMTPRYTGRYQIPSLTSVITLVCGW
jgi:hypothetical protein